MAKQRVSFCVKIILTILVSLNVSAFSIENIRSQEILIYLLMSRDAEELMYFSQDQNESASYYYYYYGDESVIC